MKALSNIIIITIASLLFLFLIRLSEAVAGFEWDFHPDARTYIEAKIVWRVWLGENPLFIVNNLFYLIVDILDKNISYIIALNYIFFCWTNVVIWKIHNIVTDRTILSNVLIVFVLFNPYRLHLANFVLKDTLIIFFVTLTGLYFLKNKIPVISIILSIMLRYASLFYYLAFFKFRRVHLVAVIILTTFFIQLFDLTTVVELLHGKMTGDMRARVADSIPIFIEYGNYAGILRMLIWPVILVSGAFIVFSPSVFMLALAISHASLSSYWAYHVGARRFLFSVAPALAILAFLTPGFVPFQRYAFPLLIIASICLFEARRVKKRDKSR